MVTTHKGMRIVTFLPSLFLQIVPTANRILEAAAENKMKKTAKSLGFIDNIRNCEQYVKLSFDSEAGPEYFEGTQMRTDIEQKSGSTVNMSL